MERLGGFCHSHGEAGGAALALRRGALGAGAMEELPAEGDDEDDEDEDDEDENGDESEDGTALALRQSSAGAGANGEMVDGDSGGNGAGPTTAGDLAGVPSELAAHQCGHGHGVC